MSENALAKREEYAIVARNKAELAEIIDANVGTDGNLTTLDLDRVKIPTGGGLQWTVPALDGDKIAKEMTGIIVHWRDGRVFWSHAYGDAPAGPPDCKSNDCKVGIGDPGGICKTCRFAQFGSALKGGKGQACKQVRLLFVIQSESILPLVLPLPPTSLKGARRYFLRLSGNNLPFYAVETRFILEQSQNAGGVKYSRVSMSMARRLEPEELQRVKEYSEQIKASLAQVQVGAEDYVQGEEAEISESA